MMMAVIGGLMRGLMRVTDEGGLMKGVDEAVDEISC